MKLVRVRSLQRTYRPRATIEIRVTQPRKIGKYTRVKTRRGKAPLRARPLPDARQDPAGEMPDRLSRRATLLLVALAFGLTFGVQALLGGGSSAGRAAGRAALRPPSPRTRPLRGPSCGWRRPGPSRRCASRGRRASARARPRKRERKPSARKVATAAPRVQPAPVTPAPDDARPDDARRNGAARAHRRSARAAAAAAAPKPIAPKPAPAPTSAPPPSGEFDTTGER